MAGFVLVAAQLHAVPTRVMLEYTLHLSNPITSKGEEIWEQGSGTVQRQRRPTFMAGRLGQPSRFSHPSGGVFFITPNLQ